VWRARLCSTCSDCSSNRRATLDITRQGPVSLDPGVGHSFVGRTVTSAEGGLHSCVLT
jgi:hypothetical protein